MIPNRAQNLFQFISFLHSNIENFNKYDDVISRLYYLGKKRYEIRPEQKLKLDEIQAEINDKHKIMMDSIIYPIKNSAKELNIWNWIKFDSESVYKSADEEKLLENLSGDEIKSISSIKRKYFEFRKHTNADPIFSMSYFFYNLDKLLMRMFEFCIQTKKEEFKKIKVKFDDITVNEIGDLFEFSYNAISLSDTVNNTAPPIDRTTIFNELKIALKKYPNEYDLYVLICKVYFKLDSSNVKIFDDNILTPENWEEQKEIFFNHRIKKYPESYSVGEKINLELEGIQGLENLKNRYPNATDYKILFQRYKEFLQRQINCPEGTIHKLRNETYSFKFVNNFDDVSETDVYNHFKKLVNKKALTDKQLNEYLIMAFQEESPPKKLLEFRNVITKASIRKIFYDYYNTLAQRPHGRKDKYVKLLTDYFKGYPFESNKTNFSKRNY